MDLGKLVLNTQYKVYIGSLPKSMNVSKIFINSKKVEKGANSGEVNHQIRKCVDDHNYDNHMALCCYVYQMVAN